jgi:hypothetical protein
VRHGFLLWQSHSTYSSHLGLITLVLLVMDLWTAARLVSVSSPTSDASEGQGNG